jgi:plastocyanin
MRLVTRAATVLLAREVSLMTDEELPMLVPARIRGRLAVFASCTVLLGLLGLAACGGSSAGSSPTATTPPTDTATTSATATATTAATTPPATGAATITMGTGIFSGSTSVSIKAGQGVTLNDANGGPHDLVIGTHGQFTAETGAPAELNNQSGIAFDAGVTMTVTFANAGTFHITCTLHPGMQATVTVTP